MSDMFNHALDAYESLETFGYQDAPSRRRGAPYTPSRGGSTYTPSRKIFVKDPLYYHRRVSYDCVIHATEKAYLIQKEGKEFWVPKQLVASISEQTITVHRCYNWGWV